MARLKRDDGTIGDIQSASSKADYTMLPEMA
jgi:hypothetical protein